MKAGVFSRRNTKLGLNIRSCKNGIDIDIDIDVNISIHLVSYEYLCFVNDANFSSFFFFKLKRCLL